MSTVLRRLLATKGVHFFVTKFGTQNLRRVAFDEKYRRGHWLFSADSTGELPETVRRYLRGGDLLVLGCGSASVLEGLEGSGLRSALGVDLSAEAIRRAARFASSTVRFQVADMESFDCPDSYDEILFSESLYYVPAGRQMGLLNRLGAKLKPGGVFIVTLCNPERYLGIVKRIRSNFRVLEDRAFSGSERQLMVFQPGTTFRQSVFQKDTR